MMSQRSPYNVYNARQFANHPASYSISRSAIGMRGALAAAPMGQNEMESASLDNDERLLLDVT